MRETKSVQVGYRLPYELVVRIKIYKEQKEKLLGVKFSNNQIVEMLLSEALNINDIK